VFKALLDSEVEAAAGKAKRDSSITPANYTFELLGEQDMDGFHTFVVNAIPKRKDKYLFEGKVWIEATEFAIVRIEGRLCGEPVVLDQESRISSGTTRESMVCGSR
jgi:hypothetical protein